MILVQSHDKSQVYVCLKFSTDIFWDSKFVKKIMKMPKFIRAMKVVDFKCQLYNG